jgi:peroxisomal 3,2-trans-enoyl-CoA isomerase
MAGPVTLEYRGKIAVITIDNVEKLNALDQDGYYQVASFMREVAEHEEVFVTVLTGKGMFTSLQNIID